MLTDNIAKFLQAERILRLASKTKEGKLHLVPLCFVYLDGSLWIHAEGKRKRNENFKHNPEVMVLIDHYYDKDWKKNKGLLIEGTILIHKAGTKQAYKSQKALEKKYTQYKLRWENEDVTMVEIQPQHIKQWRIDKDTTLY